jgi:hypothetical protein
MQDRSGKEVTNCARYIVWDPRDNDGRGPRRCPETLVITSDGVIGRVGPDNVYLTTYADYQPVGLTGEVRRHTFLAENDHVPAEAWFRLSGSRGLYEIYRVSDVAES